MTEIHWSAAGRLLNCEMPDGYIEERTASVSAEKRVIEAGTQSALIFRIGMEWLALSSGIVQEVAERARLHRVPHRIDGVLRGLVNVRGELLLCVAIDVLLRLEGSLKENRSQNQTRPERLLVCNRQGIRLAFFVNEVHGVHCFHPSDLRDVPATTAKAAATYTLGVLHWKDRTVGCLNDELLFYDLNKGLA